MLLIRPLVFYFFHLSARAEGYLNMMLLISSYYVVGQAMNTLLIAGIFRVRASGSPNAPLITSFYLLDYLLFHH